MALNIQVEGQVCEVVGADWNEMLSAVKNLPGLKANGKAMFDSKLKVWVVDMKLGEVREELAPLQVLTKVDEIEYLHSAVKSWRQIIIDSEEEVSELIKELDEKASRYSHNSKSREKAELRRKSYVLFNAKSTSKSSIEDLYELQIFGLRSACEILGHEVEGTKITNRLQETIDRDLHPQYIREIKISFVKEENSLFIQGCIPFFLGRRLKAEFKSRSYEGNTGISVIKRSRDYKQDDVQHLYNWLTRFNIIWGMNNKPFNSFDETEIVAKPPNMSVGEALEKFFYCEIDTKMPSSGAAVLGGSEQTPTPTDAVLSPINIRLKNIEWVDDEVHPDDRHENYYGDEGEYYGVYTLSNGATQRVVCIKDTGEDPNENDSADGLGLYIWRRALGENKQYWWCRPAGDDPFCLVWDSEV